MLVDCGGDIAVTSLPDTTWKLEAATEPKDTLVVPVNAEPVIVTFVPPVVGPEFGKTLVTLGSGRRSDAGFGPMLLGPEHADRSADTTTSSRTAVRRRRDVPVPNFLSPSIRPECPIGPPSTEDYPLHSIPAPTTRSTLVRSRLNPLKYIRVFQPRCITGGFLSL